MIASSLVLAVVVGAGTVPIPDSVSRFPDPSYWPGIGVQQVGMMLRAVRADAGLAMRSEGPGPGQVIALGGEGRAPLGQAGAGASHVGPLSG